MLSPPAFSFPTKVLLLAEMNRKIKSMKEREIVMITIQGLYNTAVCYTPELEEAARKQIQTVAIRPSLPAARSGSCPMSTLARAVPSVPP